MTTIYFGADHAGLMLKNHLRTFLAKKRYHVHDLGAYELNKKDDYPNYAAKVAKLVVKDKNSKGILICGSAQGICIAANKIKGTRAVAIDNLEDAKLTREHNNANILCLSGWHLSPKKAESIVLKWIKTPFTSAKRHVRRIKEISKLEK